MKLAGTRIVVGWLLSLTLAVACTAPAKVSGGEEFGSLRNARVAVDSPQRELVYFTGAVLVVIGRRAHAREANVDAAPAPLESPA